MRSLLEPRNVAVLTRRAARAGPRPVARRLHREITEWVERVAAPRRAERFKAASLIHATESMSVDDLWQYLVARPYPAHTQSVQAETYERVCKEPVDDILRAAENALAHRVSLLGSGPVNLGDEIDWQKDHKSGYRWPRGYARGHSYVNLDDSSDVKFPWELSRLQWLIPVGQAYLLTGDEHYADATRSILTSWMNDNPYADSVNWAIAMEPAMRIFTWTWLFHVFQSSQSWRDPRFRERFLESLFLHADYVDRHIEYSDVNGNHCTADAAALVFASLFFGRGRHAHRWLRRGWSILNSELPKQVFQDGVDYEGSVPYHRFVLELFLLPALYRMRTNHPVPAEYRKRLAKMARFVSAYSSPGGNAPVWGDADDGRALPLGSQSLNDHRYLVTLVTLGLGIENDAAHQGPQGEAFWWFGPDALETGLSRPSPHKRPGSEAFIEGGLYVMRNESDHVLIDCGRVGLADRGGHGHNDCLSFEATLEGAKLVVDRGAYVYTASPLERNEFRSTSSHNTPVVDGEEINRFVRPDWLWALTPDAIPEMQLWEPGWERDVFRGTHFGYLRLSGSVKPVRSITLDHVKHTLVIHDLIQGAGVHSIEVPVHLAPGIGAEQEATGSILLRSGAKEYNLVWSEDDRWSCRIVASSISPSYGVLVPSIKVVWEARARLPLTLTIAIIPSAVSVDDVLAQRREDMAGSLT